MLKNSFWRGFKGGSRAGVTAPTPGSPKGGNSLIESPKFTSRQSESAYYRFLFGSADDEPPTVPQKLAMESLRDALGKKDQRASAIPRLPTVIPKLLRSLRDPESSARDYYTIVNKDPALSAAVLKLANSVYFNPAGTYIGDIEKAVVKLGISGLRSVLSAAVMQPLIHQDSPYFSRTGQRLWQHSLDVAVACELTAPLRGLEPFKVYLLGLVHDLGKITIFANLCKEHRLNGEDQPGARAFVPLMKASSTSLSYIIANDWELPDDLCLALQEQVDAAPGKKVSAYGQLLFEANIACEAYAVVPRGKREALAFLLQDLGLPKDLFDKLDDIAKQV